jgi:transposase
MRDKDLYRTILGIEEPWSIADVTMEEDKETITVRVELKPGAKLPCSQCGRSGCAVKDRRERTWRHLDTCQFKTFINAPLPRTDCPECGVKTTAPPWAEKHSRFTLLFERFVIDALLEMSVTGVCRLLRLTWDEADGIMARAVKRGLSKRDLSTLTRIGIDEKSVGKGHRYVSIVYNLDTSKVVWVGEDRREETLDRFFAALGKRGRERIECITMDMWKPYRASCRKWIADADAKTVLDRFHIEKHLNEAVDKVRRQEHLALQKQGIDLLTKSKWDWLYHPENLPPKREARFEQLRQFDLRTVRAHALKENFRHFWQYTYPGNASRFFKRWYFWATHSRMTPIIKVAKSLKRHFERIVSYFKFRATNSIAEGINNKIQSVKKKAYGFRNTKRFINAIYFHCGGLELDPL